MFVTINTYPCLSLFISYIGYCRIGSDSSTNSINHNQTNQEEAQHQFLRLWLKRLINIVQATPFSAKAYEDASAHLQTFLEISSTITIKDVARHIILLRLFPFSLVGRAKQWFYTNREDINTWAKCSKAFLEKFFPIDKTNALREKISNFQ